MSMSDIELLLSKTIDTKKLYSNNVSDETRAGRSERAKQRARDGTLNLLERNKGGWNHSDKTRQQMKASQKKVWENNTERRVSASKRERAKARSFHTPYGVFSSVREASEVLGINKATLYSRLSYMPDRYYLGDYSPETLAKISATVVKKKPPSRGSAAKPIMTPNGLFPSRKAAAQAANVDPVTINVWLKKWPKEYYYV